VNKIKRLLVLMIIAVFTMVTFIGCSSTPASDLGEKMKQDANKAAQAQTKIEKNQPAPALEWSNSRENIAKRNKTFNDPNKVSWAYLYLEGGGCIGFTSIKGCVTSLSAYMVPDESIVKDPYYGSNGSQGIVIQQPDIDGTYGTNGDGVFWYDTAGNYWEWRGVMLVVDQPLKLNVPVLEYRQVK
jgi:hypothetical protein